MSGRICPRGNVLYSQRRIHTVRNNYTRLGKWTGTLTTGMLELETSVVRSQTTHDNTRYSSEGRSDTMSAPACSLFIGV